MNKKMTKAQVIGMMMNDVNIASNEVYMNYLAHELELINNKSANRKESAKQVENKGIKEVITEVLQSSGKAMRVKDILESNNAFDGMTTQKISALCAQLEKEGILVKEYDKKVALYKVA